MTMEQISFNYLEPLPLSKEEKIKHHRNMMRIYNDHVNNVTKDFVVEVDDKPKTVSRRHKVRHFLRGKEK